MAKKFEVEVYTKDERLFQFDWDLEKMRELLRDLRDYSFIKLDNEYMNKMNISSVSFPSPEMLNDIRDYVNGGTLKGGMTWGDIQKKYTGTSDLEEKYEG